MLQARIAIALYLRTLQVEGSLGTVDITAPESQLLLALGSAEAHRVGTQALLTQLSLPINAQGKRALGVRIVRLRKKLLDAGASDPTIKSIRNSGYQLCVPVRVISDSDVSHAISTRSET